MIAHGTTGFQGIVVQGIAILLIALALDLLKDFVFDTGETYVSILGRFASKRETALILIGFALGGSYLSAYTQRWLVSLISQHFSFALGIGILSVIFVTNRQANSWKVSSTDDPVLVGAALLGAALIIIPLL